MLLEVLSGPSKHITNTAEHTDGSQQVHSPNISSKSRPCAGFLFTKPLVHTAMIPIFPRRLTLGGMRSNTSSKPPRSIFSNPLPLLGKKKSGGFFLIKTQGDSLTFSTPEAMMVCIFRSKHPPPLT